jgi:hypothetical protein
MQQNFERVETCPLSSSTSTDDERHTQHNRDYLVAVGTAQRTPPELKIYTSRKLLLSNNVKRNPHDLQIA